MACSWHAHGIFMGCSWDVHRIFMGFSWDVHGMSLDLSNKQSVIFQGFFERDNTGYDRSPVGRERVGAMVVDIQDIRSDRKKLNQFPNHIVVIYIAVATPKKKTSRTYIL